jgi:hypothetical protein
MDYSTLRRLSAYSDQSLTYILIDATEAWRNSVEIGDRLAVVNEAKYLAEISNVSHVLLTRALTRIPK